MTSFSTKSDLIKRILHEAIEQKLFPACVVGVVNKDGDRIVVPGGRYTFENGSPLVESDSIFDVASITKVLPTASLAFQAIDEGKLSLDDKVIDYVPQLNNQYKHEITIRHLFTQTLNFGFRMSSHKDKKPNEILNVIFNSDLTCPPGENKFNSNATSILLGLVIERIFDNTLEALLSERFTQPLGMIRTRFNPLNKFLQSEIVPSQDDLVWRNKRIQGEVNDEITYTLNRKMNTGAAGLFSTTPDLLNFVETLLNDGTFQDKQIFSSKTIALKQTGLGYDVGESTQIGQLPSNTTISKTGHTGCIIIADIENGIGFAILTNYIFGQDKKDTTLNLPAMIDRYKPLNDFRIKVINAVYEGI